MDRRTLLLGTGGLTASWLLSPGVAEAQEWTPVLTRFVLDYQEREYLRLADALGLDSAKSAFEKISNRTPLTPELRKAALTLPTPYEDPRWYLVMTKTRDGMTREANELGPPLPRPLLATLASGDVEARTVEEPTTKTPIVFFEHGLFPFFYDIAKLMAWAAPTLSLEQLSDDSALARVRRRHTMPLQASSYFAATLYAYVMSGTPVDSATPVPEPTDNLPLSILLLNHMERFVLAHELAHIREGHLNQPPDHKLEYHADALAVSLVTTLANEHHRSWAVGYWACELALTALSFLYRAIGFYTYGPAKLEWISPTHPDPLSRRDELRGAWLNPRSPKEGVTAAREMCGMTESLLSRLWEITLAAWAVSNQRGARASPRWKKTAAHWKAAGVAR